MTAIARLTSENKVDKMYALKYYTNYLISLLTFSSSIYFIYKDLYFNTFVFFCYSILFFRFKNIYADYSKESKCKHPNTVQEYLNLINIRNKTFFSKFMEDEIDGGIFVISFIAYTLIFGFIGILISAGVSKHTGVNIWFYLANFFIGHIAIITMFLIFIDLKKKDVNLEKIDFSLIEKTKTIEFNSPQQKEKFFNDIKRQFNINKNMNRHQLFHIIDIMKDDVEKVDIIDFFDKQVEKKTD